MSESEQLGLTYNMPRILARRRLEFILDSRAAWSSTDGAPDTYLIELVNQAYPDDDGARAVMIEAISRRS